MLAEAVPQALDVLRLEVGIQQTWRGVQEAEKIRLQICYVGCCWHGFHPLSFEIGSILLAVLNKFAFVPAQHAFPRVPYHHHVGAVAGWPP